MDVPQDRIAPLSRKSATWVPSVEVRGEGLFLQFHEERVRQWCASPEVLRRSRMLFDAHQTWRRQRRLSPPEAGYPGMRFVLLHSFAHALMRQLSIECGYSSASLRERIYARDDGEPGGPMAGVLIYTAAPDSEGTLGGLVSLGEPQTLLRHIDQALEAITLCGSDPLCAEHEPGTSGLALHGAACHACLFAAETSCERGNKYLDRSVLVETVTDGTAPAFFRFEKGVGETVREVPVEAAMPGEPAPEGEGIPVYDLPSLGQGIPIAWRTVPGTKPAPNTFLLSMPGDGLDERITPGAWCLFETTTPADVLPARDSVVIVRDSRLRDPDAGDATVRRLHWNERINADGEAQCWRVALRPASSRLDHPTQYIEVPAADWPTWRPLARFLRLVKQSDSEGESQA